MSYCVLGGIVVGVWALLSIVGNEHVRRVRNLERKYALPPLRPAPVMDVFVDPASSPAPSPAKAA